MKYNSKIVVVYFVEMGLPKPELEYRFHPERRWRFDFAWPDSKVAIEVQGGLFVMGRHTRGAALRKEHEKLNAAAAKHWGILYLEPQNLCLAETVELIKRCL